MPCIFEARFLVVQRPKQHDKCASIDPGFCGIDTTPDLCYGKAFESSVASSFSMDQLAIRVSTREPAARLGGLWNVHVFQFLAMNSQFLW